jgi:hypothetical protein
MRDASESRQRFGFTCQSCRRFIVTGVEGLFSNPSVGSSQRFCSPACRQAAFRRRQAGVAEDLPAQRLGGRGRSLIAAQKPGEVMTQNRT